LSDDSGMGDLFGDDAVAGSPERNGRAAVRNPMDAPEPYKRCGAKKRDGTPCRAAAMPNGRCRLHGGATPGGIASPNFKHGRRSKYLKHLCGDLRDGFRAALTDPNLLAMNEEVALLQTRVSQLLDQLSATAPPPWGQAVEALNDLKLARDGDRDAKLAELERVVRQGADAAASHGKTWAELRKTIDLKGKLAQAEQHLQIERNALVPVEWAVAFADALMRAAKLIIRDDDVLRRLQRRTLEMLPQSPEAASAVDFEPAPAAEPVPALPEPGVAETAADPEPAVVNGVPDGDYFDEV
jgi:hypothetical protein